MLSVEPVGEGEPLEAKENPSQETASQLTPFLKWAGGKRWLSSSYPEIIPREFDQYIEPFLGGGAIFFGLLPKRAILSDVNYDLILTYQAIREDWQAVQKALERHQRGHSKEYYYKERNRVRRTLYEKAAQFLYLNRTCWNGLYRVNLHGKFNVPKGTKSNVILPTDDFQSISNALKCATLLSVDFEDVMENAASGDFVFIDPPYTVKHNVNGFIKYNEKIFRWEDQIRLASAVVRAAKRNVKILITNANNGSIRNLYRDVGYSKKLDRYSVLAGDKNSRGKISEIAIMINYEPEEGSYVWLT